MTLEEYIIDNFPSGIEGDKLIVNIDIDIDSIGNIDNINVENIRIFELTHSKITEFEELNKFTNLESVNLINNNLSSINIDNLDNLKYLNISNNKLTSINIENSNIVNLNLSQNNISMVNIENCGNLLRLNLSNNYLTDLNLKNLDKITFLDLSNSEITNLSEISNLISLTTLWMFNDNIDDISDIIYLTNLSTFYHDHLHGYPLEVQDIIKYELNKWYSIIDSK